MARYESLNNLQRVDAHLQFIEALDTSVREAGLDAGAWVRRPLRSGEAIVFPAGVHEIPSLIAALRSLEGLLRGINAGRLVRERLHVGAVAHDGAHSAEESATVAEETNQAVRVAEAIVQERRPTAERDLFVFATQSLVRRAVAEGRALTEFRLLSGLNGDPSCEDSLYSWTPWDSVPT